MTETETDKLADLVRQKRDLLLRIREMGKRQMQIVCEGGLAQLLDVLAAKQRVLDQLQKIERDLDPFRGQDPETRRWRSPEARAACARMLDQCETILRETVEQEKQSEAALTVRRDEVAVKLQGTHQARKAHGAYTDAGRASTGQLDLMSDY